MKQTNKNAIEIAGMRDDCNVVEVYDLNKNDSSKTNIPVKSECSNIKDHYTQYEIKVETYSNYNIEFSIIVILFITLMFGMFFDNMI